MLSIILILQDQAQQILEGSGNVTPFSTYVYGFLVTILISAIVILFTYIKNLINKQFAINNAVISEYTKVTQEYNILLKEKFKREEEVRDKMLVLMGRIEATEEAQTKLNARQNELIDKAEKIIGNQIK